MFLYILTFALCLKSIPAERCPPPEDIRPCFCWESDNNLVNTFCTKITSLQQLKTSINGFRGSRISSFSIQNSEFEFLPYDIFKNLTIQHLKIQKSNLSRIGNLGEPQFYGQEGSLESLTIQDTFTRQYPFAYVSMEHLDALRTLDLHGSHVEVVHNEWFKRGPKSLTTVRFVKGKIRVVGHSAFKALTNLKLIDLSENQISYLTRWALPEPALHLEELNLE